MRWFVLALCVLGCTPKDPEKRDADEDGVVAADDCDDEDAAVHPGATDPVYDGVDANCDGLSDFDADLDGFDSSDHGGDDCDDDDDAIHPDASERCDAVDRDCDGDPIQGATDRTTWYVDGDGDGYGTNISTRQECTRPSGYAATQNDCNDADSAIHPGAAAIACDHIDNDCDGFGDEPATVTIGATPYASLTAALAAAFDGNVITLCEGVYSGAFVVADDVTIEGAGATLTTLQGIAGDAVMRVNGSSATARDLTVRGGHGYQSSLSFYWLGGGVHVPAGATLVLEDAVVEDNTADYGGGAWVAGTLTLIRSIVRDNTGTYGAGGIRVAGGGEVFLEGSTVSSNSSNASGKRCGGIDVADSEVVLDATSVVELHDDTGVCLEDSTFEGGIVRGNDDGGIYVSSGESTVRDTLITGNGGARAPVEYQGNVTLEGVTIEGSTGVSASAITHGSVGPSNYVARLVGCTIGVNTQDGANEWAASLLWGSMISTNTSWATGSVIHVTGFPDYPKSGTLTFTCSAASGCN